MEILTPFVEEEKINVQKYYSASSSCFKCGTQYNCQHCVLNYYVNSDLDLRISKMVKNMDFFELQVSGLNNIETICCILFSLELTRNKGIYEKKTIMQLLRSGVKLIQVAQNYKKFVDQVLCPMFFC